MKKRINNKLNLVKDIVQKQSKIDSELLEMYMQNLLPDDLSWEVENSLLDNNEAMALLSASSEQETDIFANMDQLFEQKLAEQQTFSKHIIAEENSINDLLQSFLTSEACEEIEEYELAMATTFRSTNVFEMLTPKDGSFLKDDTVQFLWKGEEKLELIVENNDYEPLFEGNISNGFHLPLLENQAINGLYYYKLIANGELLKIGKFYIFR